MPELPHVNKELGEDKCEYGMKKGFLLNTNAIDKDAAQLRKKSLESFVALNNKNLDDEVLMETVKTDVNKELGEEKCECGMENKFLVKTKTIYKDATQPKKKSLESFVSLNNKNLDDEVLIETVKTDVNKELVEEKCECGMENGFLAKTKTSHKDATQPEKKSLESFVSLNNKNLDDEILIETVKIDVNKELGEEKCEYRMENGFVVKTKTSDKDGAQPGKKSLESFVSLDNKNLDDDVLMETMKTDGKQSKGCVQLDGGSMEVLESKTSCGRKTKGNVPKRKHYRWKNSAVSDNFYDNHDGGDENSPRNKVKELLFLFRKLLQEDADTKEERPCHRRVDYQIAKRLEDEKKILNTDLKLLGHVPGVEVGDAFKCRMELSILGLHRQTQSGISCSKHGGKNVAASIVASEDHTDDLDDSSVLVYTGQGGSTTNSNKKPEDQKLEGGNLALTNSMVLKTPIRVIRGCDPYKRRFRKFVYIGLYLVKSYKQVTGPHGNLVYKFWLERIPGQPEVVCKEIERTRRLKAKKSVGLGNVSQGKVIPTSAVDTIDERPEAERFPTQPEAAQEEVKLTNKSNAHKGVSLDDMSLGKEVVMPCGMDTKDGERPPPLNDETVKSIGEIDVAQKGVKRKRFRSRKGVCLDEEAIPMRDVNTNDDERPPSSKYKAIKSILGEPKAAKKGVKRRKRFESKKVVCLDDISHGKELIPIRAVNTIDDEKPPSFKYATNLVYPDWCHITPPKGCDCIDGCSDSKTCSCAIKNGGEMPYSSNGTAVDGKLFLYECGPSCKCPPSCHNRVSQHGLKFKLEIFKTKLRGWGLRSRECIPLGGFICEYVGELLMDEEAEKRAGYDDYLFDIGKNHDSNTSIDEGLNNCEDVDDDNGFTIDAAEYGNVGRFINHSCSPNIYAQKILYDHEDESIPHIMFFAAEKIQPFEELTYDYHYVIDQVHDANGNIKKKSCFCGSRQCTGRLY